MAKSILLVEDDPFLGDTYKILLENKGYNIILCRDGEEALEEIKNGNEYQILVTDLSLDGYYDGNDVLDLSKLTNPNIPAVCISGYDVKPRGFDGNIKKPMDSINDLVKIIESHLQKSNP